MSRSRLKLFSPEERTYINISIKLHPYFRPITTLSTVKQRPRQRTSKEVTLTYFDCCLMLNALRRGPASVARALRLSSTSSSAIVCVRSAGTKRSQICSLQRPSVISCRALHSSPQWRRTAAIAEAHDDAVEGQARQQVTSQSPPSDSENDASKVLGRVIKFRQLADLNMVNPVIVNTLTKDMGLETMTQVQSLTINETLKGIDV